MKDLCSVCAGTGKPISGLPCICDGIGTQTSEMHGLRVELFKTQANNKRLVDALNEAAIELISSAHDELDGTHLLKGELERLDKYKTIAKKYRVKE